MAKRKAPGAVELVVVFVAVVPLNVKVDTAKIPAPWNKLDAFHAGSVVLTAVGNVGYN